MQPTTLPEANGPNQADFGTSGPAISVEQLRRILIRRRLVVILFTLVCVGATILYVSLAKKQYSSAATLDISQQNSQSNFSDLLSTTVADEQSSRMQTEEKIMASSTVLLQVADRLNLIHKSEFNWIGASASDVAHLTAVQKASLAGSLRESLVFSIVPGTSIVSIAYTSTNPVLARDVPNTLVDVYIGQDLGSGQIGTKRVSDWLQAQTADLRHQVEEASRKLADFQRTHNIIGTNESQNVQVDKLRMLNEQLATAQVDRIGKETNYRVSQTGNVELMGTLGLDPQLTALRAQQAQLKAEYDALGTRYGQGYPRLRELTQQMHLLQAQIDGEMTALKTHYRQEYETAKQNENQLRAAMQDQEKGIFNLDESAAEYAILRHDAESTRTLYDEIQMKVRESGIIDTLKSTRFRIVDDAPLPTIPVSPRRRFSVIVALVLGLLGGCILAFIVDAVDDAVHSAAEIERQTGIPVVGVVPHVQIDESRRQLLPLTGSKDGALEAFRGLRSTMLLGYGNTIPKLQVITSTTQGEGKSFIALNYARVMAQSGAKVLLVDADLRRGSIHAKTGIQSQPGLTNLLSDRNLHVDFTHPEPELPLLSVLPRGPVPPNPSELLSSERFMELLSEWHQQFDYVIVDTAPILPVSDTLALAQRADLVFLVVRIAKSSTPQLLHIVERLRRLKVPVKGLILNDITKRSSEYSYYYGGYEYGENHEQS